jgi:hypothetical protein
LSASPENRLLSRSAKALRVNESAIVVIAQHTKIDFCNNIQAFAGIRAVPNNVTQANDSIATLKLNVSQDRLQRFEVSMDIANDCSAHKNQTLANG